MQRSDNSREDFFFNGRGRSVQLVRDHAVYAVRFQRGGRSDDPSLSKETRRFICDESEHIGYLPRYGLQVYRAGTQAEPAALSRLRSLNGEAQIACATPVFRRSASNLDLVFLTNGFLVEFKREVGEVQAVQEIARLNAEFGVTIRERLKYVMPAVGYHLETPAGDGERGPIELAKRYYETGMFDYAVPEIIQRRVFRAPPRDVRRTTRSTWTYQAQQWHLAKAAVVAAWSEAGTMGDAAITIAICDDGVDVDHPEFAGKIAAQYDFEGGVADGTPKLTTDRHGTACAGVATAQGLAACGAAPGCRLMAARFPDRLGVADEARMFQWMADNGADVISCSWGPPDGTGGTYPLPGNVESAIRYCSTKGRGGKGIPIFWACGNGNELVSNDGYASNPDVIAVGAVSDVDTKAYYSDFGPEVALCAPSSGTRSAGHRYVFTTDRRGADGYNNGDPALGDAAGNYTNDFGGTSAAAPLVAGIAGLLLSVDPTLSRTAIRDVLMQTADKIGSGYDGAGHSDVFGHGRANALKAVQAVKQGFIPSPSTGGVPGVVGVPGVTSVAAPALVLRFGAAPQLAVTLPAGRFYAMEFATDVDLFDVRNHVGERNPNNYYASWQTGLVSSSPYQMPADVWDRLRLARVVYYRLLTSASASAWVDPIAVPPASQLAAAPALDLRPRVDGPTATSRLAAPPRFEVKLAQGQFYAVELATARELFDAPARRPLRTPQNFFASWQVSSELLSSSTFDVPTAAWDTLAASPRVYYRLLTSTSASAWQILGICPPVDRLDLLPSIDVVA